MTLCCATDVLLQQCQATVCRLNRRPVQQESMKWRAKKKKIFIPKVFMNDARDEQTWQKGSETGSEVDFFFGKWGVSLCGAACLYT